MIRLEDSTNIDAPVEDVWKYISDLQTMPQWTGVLKVEYKGPADVGTSVVATYKLLGLRTFNITITEWEPNHMLGMRFKLGAEFNEILTVEPVDRTMTHLTISLKGEARGFLRIAGPFISRRAAKEFSGRLVQVKNAFEARQEASRSH